MSLVCLLVLPALAQNDLSLDQARKAPEWVRKAVVYEVFTRNFSQEGTFNALTARLDELNDLGVDVLWLMPIHPLGEKNKKGALGSPYAVRDYLAIDPALGTTNDFKRLVREAHARGMKVIIDIGANHTAWDSVLMAHPEFYKQDAAGRIISPNPDWVDVAGLDYRNGDLRRYMIDMLKFWVSDFDLDGFRCDVAYEVPRDFWEAARAELDPLRPDLCMLAEASHPELLLKAFDMDYSWPLHAALNDVLLHDAPASKLRTTWEDSRRRFPRGALHLRFSDNHDEARAVARFGIRGALAAQVMMLTLDGVPLFYNGMEVGDATESGAPALFEKLPVFWEPKARPPLREIYRDLIRLRREHDAFTSDQVVWLENSRPADLVTYLRPGDQEEFLVIINFSNRPIEASITVEQAASFLPVPIAGAPTPPAIISPRFSLKGFEWRIYRRSL
jgi:glycosidase